MNKYWEMLQEADRRSAHNVVGLMSGTSCDGLDIAVCHLEPSHGRVDADVRSFEMISYPASLRQRVREIAFRRRIDQQLLTLLHRDLGKWFAGQVTAMLERNDIQSEAIDLLASHGQTVYHVPAEAGDHGATLQLGDGNQLAHHTGCITVTDFRQAFTAAGREAAPLTPHVDRMLFQSENENRILLNIGGIANFTWLPKGKPMNNEVIYSDTGPGNTLIDAAVRYYYSGLEYDENGEIARQGSVNPALLEGLLQHPFIEKNPPKSTGPESFHLEWVFRVMQDTECPDIKAGDLVMTLTRFTAVTIAEALKNTIGSLEDTRVYISGGGVHNPTLIRELQNQMSAKSLTSFDKLGVSPDAREALTFAVLGHQLVFGEGITVNSSDKKEKLYPGTIAFP